MKERRANIEEKMVKQKEKREEGYGPVPGL